MELLELDGILNDSMRQINTVSVQTVNSIVLRLEAYLDNCTIDTHDPDSLQLHVALFRLLDLWQTKLLQLETVTVRFRRGRPRADLNLELVSFPKHLFTISSFGQKSITIIIICPLENQ